MVDWTRTFSTDDVAAMCGALWNSRSEISSDEDREDAGRKWGQETIRLWRARGYLSVPVAFKKPGQKTKLSRMGFYELMLLHALSDRSKAGISLPLAAMIIRGRLQPDENHLLVNNEVDGRPTIEQISQDPLSFAGQDFCNREPDDIWYWIVTGNIYRGRIKASQLPSFFDNRHMIHKVFPCHSLFNVTATLERVDNLLDLGAFSLLHPAGQKA